MAIARAMCTLIQLKISYRIYPLSQRYPPTTWKHFCHTFYRADHYVRLLGHPAVAPWLDIRMGSVHPNITQL